MQRRADDASSLLQAQHHMLSRRMYRYKENICIYKGCIIFSKRESLGHSQACQASAHGSEAANSFAQMHNTYICIYNFILLFFTTLFPFFSYFLFILQDEGLVLIFFFHIHGSV